MHSKHNREYAFSFYLDKLLPRGGTVGVVSPKKILTNTLPEVAKKKNCKIVSLNSNANFISELMKHKVHYSLSEQPVDFFLAEPHSLARGGAFVHPAEAALLHNKIVFGVGTLHQDKPNLAKHDFIELRKHITELGISNQFNDESFS